jgi:hypothetical protein
LIEWELVRVQMLAGPGGVATGNKANGASDAVGVDAGDTTNGGVGAGKASFVPIGNKLS